MAIQPRDHQQRVRNPTAPVAATQRNDQRNGAGDGDASEQGIETRLLRIAQMQRRDGQQQRREYALQFGERLPCQQIDQRDGQRPQQRSRHAGYEILVRHVQPQPGQQVVQRGRAVMPPGRVDHRAQPAERRRRLPHLVQPETGHAQPLDAQREPAQQNRDHCQPRQPAAARGNLASRRHVDDDGRSDGVGHGVAASEAVWKVTGSDFGSRRLNKRGLSQSLQASRDKQSATSEVFSGSFSVPSVSIR